MTFKQKCQERKNSYQEDKSEDINETDDTWVVDKLTVHMSYGVTAKMQ